MEKVNLIDSVPNEIESNLNVKVQEIRLKLAIVTNFGIEPFISLVGIHGEFEHSSQLL